MLKLTLQIKPAEQAVRAVEAWFLAGDNPRMWLAELCRPGVQQVALRIYLVPRSSDDLAPAGILVTGVRGNLPLPAHGLPLGRLGERLYLPVDALLDPPVMNEELVALCLYPVMLWHPVIGLVGFEEANALSLIDLLAAPVWREEDWSAAHPGMPAPPPLTGIELRLPPPALEQFFGEERKDIGSEPIKGLPPAPNEPTNSPLDKLRRGVTGGMMRGIIGAAGMFPATSSSPTWLNNISDWAGKRLEGLSEEISRTRNKELLRLMELLKNDPEAGLRHAIPLSGLGAPRGKAPPGAWLGNRNPNFNLGSLGGGSAVDFWDVSSDWQAELRQHYQRLANRELDLHRYRRAAYIYAELLGDLSAAASALKQGKFFAEAAVLYRDRLSRPLEAAHCLAAGGFFKEAVALFEKEGSLLEAANLHRKLGDVAAAEVCIRKLITVRKMAGDHLAASELLERELGLIDEALVMLDSAWPSATQAVRCKQKWFETLGRLGRHEQTRSSLREMRRTQFNSDHTMRLAEVLLTLVEHYPDHTARHDAADISRVHISRQLANRSSHQLPVFLQHLKKLAPEDKLLTRDSSRFAAGRSAPIVPVKPVPPPIPGTMPSFLKEFSLPHHIEWSQAYAAGDTVYFLGQEKNHLHCLRGVWEGVYQGTSWIAPANQLITFTIAPGARAEGLLGPILDTRLTPKYFPSNNRHGMNASEAGTPSWMPNQVMALAATQSAVWVLRWDNSRFILASHQATGELIHQDDLTNEISGALMAVAKNVTPKMVVLAQMVIIGLGQHLFIWQSDEPLEMVECSSPVTGLTPASPYARPFILVECERSVEILWLENFKTNNVADDVQDPKCTLTTDGQVILIAGNEGRVYQPSSHSVRRASSFAWPHGTPVALVPAGQPGHFATLTSKGKVSLYKLRANGT